MYLRNDKENGWITLGLLFKCLFNACHSLSVPILFLWFLHQSEKIQIQVSGCLPEHSRRAIETRFTSSRKKKILLRLLNTCANTYGHGSFVPSKRKSPRSLPEPPCLARAEMHSLVSKPQLGHAQDQSLHKACGCQLESTLLLTREAGAAFGQHHLVATH